MFSAHCGSVPPALDRRGYVADCWRGRRGRKWLPPFGDRLAVDRRGKPARHEFTAGLHTLDAVLRSSAIGRPTRSLYGGAARKRYAFSAEVCSVSAPVSTIAGRRSCSSSRRNSSRRPDLQQATSYRPAWRTRRTSPSNCRNWRQNQQQTSAETHVPLQRRPLPLQPDTLLPAASLNCGKTASRVCRPAVNSWPAGLLQR